VHVSRGKSRGLAEEVFVNPRLVAARKVLDHGEQADADSVETGQHHAEGTVLANGGGLADQADRHGAQESGHTGPDEDGDRILGQIPQKSKRHPRQDRMGKRIPHQGQAAHQDKAPEQTTADTQAGGAGQGVTNRRILEAEESHHLDGPGRFRDVPDLGPV